MTVCSTNKKEITNYLNVLVLFFSMLILFFMTVSCENPTSGSASADSAETGSDEGVTGVTDEIDVSVENGNIYITANEEGAIEIDVSNVQLVEQFPFTYLHVFSFSPRTGTKADRFSNRVDPKMIKQRSEILRTMGKAKKKNFYNSFVGKKLDVLWEEKRFKSF